jgi:large repetitive protein
VYFKSSLFKVLALVVLAATAACHGGPGSSSLIPSSPGAPSTGDASDSAAASPALGRTPATGAASEARLEQDGVTPDTTPITFSPASLAFTAVGATKDKPVVVTETGYTGKFTITSTCTKIATFTPASASGPKATIKVTPTGAGSCDLSVKDTKAHAATLPVKVTLPTPKLAPTSLSFSLTGSAHSQTITVSETGYTGTIAQKSNCSGIATATPATVSVGGKLTVTAIKTGTCTITVTDSNGTTATAMVGVKLPVPVLAPATLSFSLIGASHAQTFTATETGYTGTLTQKTTCTSGIATVSPATLSPGGKITVTAAGNGSCKVTVTDSNGTVSAAGNVNVALPTPLLSPGTLSFSLIGSTHAQTLTVAETGYTGTLAQTNTCSTIATVTPASVAVGGKVTVTALKNGSCSVTVTDSNGKKASSTVTVALPTPSLSPASLSFNTTSPAKTLTAVEAGYTGNWTVTNTCAGIATVSPATLTSPAKTITVTAVKNGNCSVTIADSNGTKSVAATVAVAIPALVVNPNNLSFDATGVAYNQTFTVSETGSTGAFTQTNTCGTGGSAFVTVTSGFAAPSALVTVSPLNAGTCTITMHDSNGQTSNVAITVTTTSIGINAKHH